MFQWDVFGDNDPPLQLLGLDMLYRHIDLFSPSLPNSGSAFTLGCGSAGVRSRQAAMQTYHTCKSHLTLWILWMIM